MQQSIKLPAGPSGSFEPAQSLGVIPGMVKGKTSTQHERLGQQMPSHRDMPSGSQPCQRHNTRLRPSYFVSKACKTPFQTEHLKEATNGLQQAMGRMREHSKSHEPLQHGHGHACHRSVQVKWNTQKGKMRHLFADQGCADLACKGPRHRAALQSGTSSVQLALTVKAGA